MICLLKIVDGEVVKGDRITAASNGEHHDILEVRTLYRSRSCAEHMAMFISYVALINSEVEHTKLHGVLFMACTYYCYVGLRALEATSLLLDQLS